MDYLSGNQATMLSMTTNKKMSPSEFGLKGPLAPGQTNTSNFSNMMRSGIASPSYNGGTVNLNR